MSHLNTIKYIYIFRIFAIFLNSINHLLACKIIAKLGLVKSLYDVKSFVKKLRKELTIARSFPMQLFKPNENGINVYGALYK